MLIITSFYFVHMVAVQIKDKEVQFITDYPVLLSGGPHLSWVPILCFWIELRDWKILLIVWSKNIHRIHQPKPKPLDPQELQ